MRSWFRTVAALGALAGCALWEKPTPIDQLPAPGPEQKRAVLGEGDVVDIKVYREPELAGIYRVNAAGDIDFPLIGPVKLIGREPHLIESEIRERLAGGYLKQPQVMLFVREYNSKKVHVLGEVVKAGSFPYDQGMNIIMALTNAGGFNKLASTNVRVTRIVDGAERMFVVAVDQIRNGAAPNFELQPGDIVFVPEAIF